jgi:uncharacterized membrane protein
MNSGKIIGALVGLVLGLIYINYGLLNMFIVAFFVFVGYNYELLFSRLKKLIKSGDRLLRILRKKLREED